VLESTILKIVIVVALSTLIAVAFITDHDTAALVGLLTALIGALLGASLKTPPSNKLVKL
jgi:hypothetical protein